MLVQSVSLFFGITDDNTDRSKNSYAAFSCLLFDIVVNLLWGFCYVVVQDISDVVSMGPFQKNFD